MTQEERYEKLLEFVKTRAKVFDPEEPEHYAERDDWYAGDSGNHDDTFRQGRSYASWRIGRDAHKLLESLELT